MPSTVQKWGNSLGIRVPKGVAEQVNFREGTEVDFDTSGGVLTVRPRRRRKYTLAGLLAKAKGRSPHGELDRGGPVGRELV
jgi:antitoxin MazE